MRYSIARHEWKSIIKSIEDQFFFFFSNEDNPILVHIFIYIYHIFAVCKNPMNLRKQNPIQQSLILPKSKCYIFYLTWMKKRLPKFFKYTIFVFYNPYRTCIDSFHKWMVISIGPSSIIKGQTDISCALI